MTTLQQQGDNILTLGEDAGLVELISSDLPNRLYEKSFYSNARVERRFTYTQNADYYLTYLRYSFLHLSLGSTPLCQGYLLSIKVANEFKENNNIEVLSTIVLSDGGATDYLVSVIVTLTVANKLIIKHGLNSVSTTTTNTSRWGADRVMLQQSAAVAFQTGYQSHDSVLDRNQKQEKDERCFWLVDFTND